MKLKVFLIFTLFAYICNCIIINKKNNTMSDYKSLTGDINKARFDILREIGNNKNISTEIVKSNVAPELYYDINIDNVIWCYRTSSDNYINQITDTLNTMHIPVVNKAFSNANPPYFIYQIKLDKEEERNIHLELESELNNAFKLIDELYEWKKSIQEKLKR